MSLKKPPVQSAPSALPPRTTWKQYITDFAKSPRRAKAALIGSLLLVGISPAGLSALTPFVVPAFAMATGTPAPDAILLFVTLPLIAGPMVLPFVGRWVDKYGAQRIALPAVILYALATASIPLSAGIPWLMGTMLVLASIFGFSASLGVVFKVILAWFPEHRGIGFGLIGVASSLFSAVLSPVFQWLVNGNVPAMSPSAPDSGGAPPEGMAPPEGAELPPAPGGSTLPGAVPDVFAGIGWDGTYFVIAAVIAIVGIPAVLWLISEPKVVGAVVTPKELDAALPGVPFWKAVPTRAWIFIVLLLAFASTAPIAMRQNAVAFYGENGIDPATVSFSLSILFTTSVIGLLVGGTVLDRARHPWVVAILLAAVPIGMVLALVNGGSATLLFISMALLGFATGAESALGPALIARYFGLKSFAALQGLTLAISGLALALAPYLVSAMQVATGSYTVPLLVVTGLTVVAVVLAAFLPKYPKPWVVPLETGEAMPAARPAE